MTIATKGMILILKTGKEVIFNNWEKKHANGKYFIDSIGNRYSIDELA